MDMNNKVIRDETIPISFYDKVKGEDILESRIKELEDRVYLAEDGIEELDDKIEATFSVLSSSIDDTDEDLYNFEKVFTILSFILIFLNIFNLIWRKK